MRYAVLGTGNVGRTLAGELRELLRAFGWRDMLEMYLPLWLRLYGAKGTSRVNVTVTAA